ncbi:hypothetical protein [Rhodobacter capsulatus]|uniref:Uncharacterized protein n=1 Tax=Rhodobacter phage RcapNL TaxID=1131316 RepID=H6WBQ6_9CAUD|nr:hypothetical protein [Rhodobacter capsulatus]YP_007518435.1 hypothetical protein I920_gp53 [Rhodobacter phage RcapNL]AFK66568.1 hypothetical protein RHZG_00062 [Rhodobacter phage RcNL1]AFA44893.1 hypothetical protein RcapNL_00053 [Rhodobacter phage RcapNL]ETD02740.1 hypothetical protein U714_04325 [Rhodobacter capsulatus DE442]ETD78897.1 hypothetical protein U717_04330 [Rhodobacter capsulatus R121]ETE54876.1 hypothetical protein U715_04320 [Rhodobacter capsulatus Y262]
MSDLLRRIHETARALVQGHGCLDSVSALIEARFGRGPGKGTLSKRMSGELDWTLPDIIALEDAAGRYPVTDLLCRRRAGAVAGAVRVDLIAQAGAISKEHGEAMDAMMRAIGSQDAGDRARAAVEMREAIEAMTKALRALEGA